MVTGQASLFIPKALFRTLIVGRFGVDLPRRFPMSELFELSRCCAEAQADGVPCPTLGRDCQVCERAMIVGGRVVPPPPPPIRPVGQD